MHEGVHWWSWTPIQRSLVWAKWFFGAKCVKGYEDPRSFWKSHRSKAACPLCGTYHNQSIHGVIAYCPNADHPVLSAYLASWGLMRSLVHLWRQSASPHDLQLSGKLLCPTTLIRTLVESQGYRQARRAVSFFYGSVLTSLEKVLPKWTEEEKQAFKLRLDPFQAEGWGTRRTCLPHP